MKPENEKNLIKQLSIDEGRKNFPYLDTVGIWTIGIGRNLKVGLSDDELLLIFQKTDKKTYLDLVNYFKVHPLTELQIDYLFKNDINKHTEKLFKLLPWIKNLSEIRQCVLINMAFNMGEGNGVVGLTSFKNTLSLIENGKYEDAARNMLMSKWAAQVHGRAQRLAKQMQTNIWQIN